MDQKNTEILNFILKWCPKDVRVLVGFGWEHYHYNFDVVKCFEIFFERYRYYELYKHIVESFGLNSVHDFFCWVLDGDPSNSGGLISMESFYLEKPIPKYVVSVVYLIIFSCIDVGSESLGSSVWENLVRCRHAFPSETLRAILDKFFYRSEILSRSIELFTRGNRQTNELALNILKSQKFEKMKIARIIASRINKERNVKKRNRLENVFVKYFNPIVI